MTWIQKFLMESVPLRDRGSFTNFARLAAMVEVCALTHASLINESSTELTNFPPLRPHELGQPVRGLSIDA